VCPLRQNRSLTLPDLGGETGEVRQEWQMTVGALLQALLPGALLPEGLPFAAAARTPRWATFPVQGRTDRAVAYRAWVSGMGGVQVVVAQE